MTEKLKDILCCGKPATIEQTEQKGEKGYGILCQEECGNGIFSVSKETAIDQFLKHPNSKDNRQPELAATEPQTQSQKASAPKKETKRNMSNQLAINNAGNLAASFKNRELSNIISPVVSGNQSAMDRLMNNNTVRYPLTLKGKAWDAIWEKEKENGSIVKGIEDALILGAELGKMGDLVPYGETCQFIPSVEAYEFVLTNGNNAPFENITIECIYESDDYVSGRKKGDFFLDFNSFWKTREKVIMVAVYGLLKKTGYIVGEMYDAVRLLEKAEAHSKPYANYMKITKAFDYAKSEGRSEIDENGREWFKYFVIKSQDQYFENDVAYFKEQEAAGKLKGSGKSQYAVQSLPKKGGGTWDKKIYRSAVEDGKEEKIIYIDELDNPYAGADQPEMLRKAAGKSFLSKFAKIRNSEAAMDEVRSSESMRKSAIDLAGEQFETIEGEV